MNVGGEDFWDGGLGFPNPIELTTWEANRIWPGCTHDVTISLGTGKATKTKKSCKRGHSIQRLWSSFMDFLDGQTRLYDMTNGLSQQRQKDFFRLDTELPFPIRLDDVETLNLQKNGVKHVPGTQLIDAATAMLVSNFYFQLQKPLLYCNGMYKCEGLIRCRGDASQIISSLSNLHSDQIKFLKSSECLAECIPGQDICDYCCRYRRPVSFYVRHPSDMVTISLHIGSILQRNISGFPQTMSWFEHQQGFQSPFGPTEHDKFGPRKCPMCSTSSKRKWTGEVGGRPHKGKRK